MCRVRRKYCERVQPNYYRVVCALGFFTLFMLFFVSLMVFVVLPAAAGNNIGAIKQQELDKIINFRDGTWLPTSIGATTVEIDESETSTKRSEETHKKRDIPSIIQWNVFYFEGSHEVLKKHRDNSKTSVKVVEKEIGPAIIQSEHENSTKVYQEEDSTELVPTTTIPEEMNNEDGDVHEHMFQAENGPTHGHKDHKHSKNCTKDQKHDDHEIEENQEPTTETDLDLISTTLSETMDDHSYSSKHKLHQHKIHYEKEDANLDEEVDYMEQEDETTESQMISTTPELLEDHHEQKLEHDKYDQCYHHKSCVDKKHHHLDEVTTVEAVPATEGSVKNEITFPVSHPLLTTIRPEENFQVTTDNSVITTEPVTFIVTTQMPFGTKHIKKKFGHRVNNRVHPLRKPKPTRTVHRSMTAVSHERRQDSLMRFKSIAVTPSTERNFYWNHAKLKRMRGCPRKDHKVRRPESTTASTTTVMTIATEESSLSEVTEMITTTTEIPTTMIPTTISSSPEVTTISDDLISTEAFVTISGDVSSYMGSSTTTSQAVTKQTYVPPRKDRGWPRKVKKAKMTPASTTLRSKLSSSTNEFRLNDTRTTTYNPFVNPSTPKVVPAIYFQSIFYPPSNQIIDHQIKTSTVPSKPSTYHQYFVKEKSEHFGTRTTGTTTTDRSNHPEFDFPTLPTRERNRGTKRKRKRNKQRASLVSVRTRPMQEIPSTKKYKCRTYPSANNWGHHCSLSEIRLTNASKTGITLDSDVPRHNITEIDLGGWSGSSITTLSSDFCDTFPNILFFHGTHLGLKRIETTAFANCTNLRRLHLSNNELAELPLSIFAQNELLTWISLGSNKFTVLDPGLFLTTRNLIAIELENNRLRKFPVKKFNSLKMLRQLDLRDNQLTDVDEQELFRKFPKLQSLFLCGNDQINERRRKVIFECFDLRNLECDLTINC